MVDLDRIYYMVPWTGMSQPLNGISIGSAIFTQHIRVTNTQTDRLTHRRAASIAIRRIRSLMASDAA